MGLPQVSIKYQNGGLGRVAVPDDRVVALVINGIQDNPLQLFSASEAFGHASTADATYGPEYLRQIQDFYRVAGEGAELWVQPVSSSISTVDLFNNGLIANLLDAAEGRINVVGLSRYDAPGGAARTIAGGFDADIFNALDEAHAVGVAYATLNKPVRFIMDGKNYSGTPADLDNLKARSFHRVAVCLGANKAGAKNAAIGLLLGRIASIPVNRNIGRVKDGAATSDGHVTNGQSVKVLGSKATALHDKGYIFLRAHALKAGYFWNDDHMATTDTDDYYSLANGRVIDKAARIAYATFLEELLDEVQVDAATGRIAVTTVKGYQAKIERAIGLAMAADGEISGVQAFIDPTQDILATSKLVVDLRVTPTGTTRVIEVKLGLSNPNAA